MDDFPVSNSVEQSVNRQVNALVGNNDINLNTIVKMSLLKENSVGFYINDNIQQEVLAKITKSNKVEQYWIDKEFELTMDSNGNIIPVNINAEKDTTSVILESEGSE